MRQFINNQTTSLDWRGYVKFSQRFVDEEGSASKGGLKNVFYSIMADYSQSYFKREDASHGDDFFKYGHVGTFDVFQQNSYEYNDLTGRFVHNGWEDTLVTFQSSPFAPDVLKSPSFMCGKACCASNLSPCVSVSSSSF